MSTCETRVLLRDVFSPHCFLFCKLLQLHVQSGEQLHGQSLRRHCFAVSSPGPALDFVKLCDDSCLEVPKVAKKRTKELIFGFKKGGVKSEARVFIGRKVEKVQSYKL